MRSILGTKKKEKERKRKDVVERRRSGGNNVFEVRGSILRGINGNVSFTKIIFKNLNIL